MTNDNKTTRGKEEICRAQTIYKFEKKVRSTIEKYDMIQKGSTVLVALSGGADSVSLLYALSSLAQEYRISLCACHLNHCIRGSDADSDEDFSRSLCQKLGIGFYSEKIDIPALCSTCKDSVETVARMERYAFFDRAAKKFGARFTATAHTMSDNAETLIFNLCRGSGADGLCAIPPKRGAYIRPLIETSRSEVEEYLSARGQSFVTDVTNSDEEYSRNFIRHSIMPQLKKLNPSAEEAFLRLSDSARRDRVYFESEISRLLDKKLSLCDITALPDALLSRYIRAVIYRASDSERLISSNRINAVIEAVRNVASDGGEKRISIPCELSVVISSDGLNISNGKKNDQNTLSFNIPLHVGKNIINEMYAVYICTDENTNIPDIIENEDFIYKLDKKIHCISDIIKKGVYARNRLPGDVFRLGGITRKLKKVFSEAKLSQHERSVIPIICLNDGCVAALPLYSAPCDRIKPQDTSEKIIIAFYKAVI